MTAREFQRKYHDYVAETQVEAEAEAARANQSLNASDVAIHGPAVAVDFGDLGWGLMLQWPRDEARRLGVLKS